MRRESIKNSLSGVAHILVNTGLMLVLVPVFIGRLGIETYGIYALIMAIGNLGTFTNFGFNTSLIKYLVEQKDRQLSNNDIWVTFLIIGAASVMVVSALIVMEEQVVLHLLQLQPDVYDGSVRLFYFTILCAGALLVIGQVPSAILDSQQKVYLTNGVQLVTGALSKVSVLIALIVAPDLATIGWIMLGAQAVAFISLSILARMEWGPMRPWDLGAQFIPVARKHLRYGRSIYASSIMFYFYEPATKILIGRFIGVAEVGFFDIALRVKGAVWSIMERMLYPVMPLLASKERTEDIRRVIEEVQQKLLLIVLPLTVGVIFASESVISLWLGNHLPEVVIGTILIVTTYLVTLTFVPLYQFLSIKGHPEKTLVLQTLNVVVNVGIFFLLVPMMGYFGAVTAFCTAVVSSTFLCAWYQWKYLGSLPISSLSYAGRLGRFGLSLVISNLFIVQVPLNDASRVGILFVVNATLTVMFLRVYRMITIEDIERYLGSHSAVARFAERLLVGGTRA